MLGMVVRTSVKRNGGGHLWRTCRKNRGGCSCYVEQAISDFMLPFGCLRAYPTYVEEAIGERDIERIYIHSYARIYRYHMHKCYVSYVCTFTMTSTIRAYVYPKSAAQRQFLIGKLVDWKDHQVAGNCVLNFAFILTNRRESASLCLEPSWTVDVNCSNHFSCQFFRSVTTG